MSTYTGTWNFYNSFKEYMADGSIDLDDTSADVFKVMLVKSTYTPDLDNHSVLADITGEIAATGGYSRKSLTGVTWTRSGAVLTWNANDTIWAATGADFEAARYWVLYDDTTATKVLISYGLINNAPADVIVSDGTDFTLRWDALGLFTLT
jgi:hypothetical protein